jgi:hypothetical protein
MEHNKETSENKGKAESTKWELEWGGGGICLPPSKDIWRRVFNKRLRCYEIYIRKTNILVATGIGNTADSFLIGSLPVIVEIMSKTINEIENGEVDEKTLRGLKHIITTFKKNIRKGETMDRNGVFGWDSPELHLGGEDGGSVTEVGLHD